jgi:hypothetical protein
MSLDRARLRPDGIGQVCAAQERIAQGGRVVASLQCLGYVVPPIALPEVPVSLAPAASRAPENLLPNSCRGGQVTDGSRLR